MTLYKENNYKSAIRIFEDVMEKNPEDEITKIYLSKSLNMAHFHRLNQIITKLPNFKIKKIKIFYITIITSQIRKIR
jgi:hypothetical protein